MKRATYHISLAAVFFSCGLVFAQERAADIGAETPELPAQQDFPAQVSPEENLSGLENASQNLSPTLESPVNPELLSEAAPPDTLQPMPLRASAANVSKTLIPAHSESEQSSTRITLHSDKTDNVSATAELHATASQNLVKGDASDDETAKLSAAFDGIEYPATRRDESVVDDYFGTKVADPYRWLEDDNSEETKAWVAAQNEVTGKFLEQIPERQAIAQRLKELWNYERFSTPEKAGDRWFFFHNAGLQEQDILYTAKSLNGERTILLDPNALSSDGTISLSGISVSRDGRYLAYSISKAGSDWVTWKIRDVETGKDLTDTIEWTKFTDATWDPDGNGFYYQRFPEPKAGDELTSANLNAKIYYHALGTSQQSDILVKEQSDQPEWSFGTALTKDERFLLLYQYEGSQPKNRVWVKDLSKSDSVFEPLFDAFDAEYSIVGNDGERFYVLTNRDAPRRRLVAVDLRSPDPKNWKTIIPQDSGRSVLEDVARIGNRFVATWLEDVHNEVKVYGPRGSLQYAVRLPGLGSVGLPAQSLKEDKMTFFTFTSFNYPTTIFRLNTETGRYTAWQRPAVPINPSEFEVKQVFYPSKDGTKIPMFIVYKKGLKLDGQNPTYLYGYGGFGISLLPHYSGGLAAWLERGGIYAVANLRGGGEYGEEWRNSGRLQNKQNVFDDFIAAAEYLIKEKYTSTPKLAIGGGSNGGLLVGAAMTQRPELFGAAVPEVGVMDMLRFHRPTAGRGWVKEYGSSEEEEGFRNLIKYSPLHNIKPGVSYPATLVMTGDHDDRVVPAHSHKFTATLQVAQGGSAPVLTLIQTNGGHGGTGTLSSEAQEIADKWAFLLRVLGVSKLKSAERVGFEPTRGG